MFAKTIISILLMLLSFTAFADKRATNINENKTFVIKYDDTIEQFLQASTAIAHRNTPNSFHLRGDVDVAVLGEKKEILIPNIKESFFLFFRNQFCSAKFYLSQTNYWKDLDSCIQQIEEMKDLLSQLSQLAIKEEAFDRRLLSKQYFEKEPAVAINWYELEHYKIFLILKKFPVPAEIIPHEGDYFQLHFRVDNIDN